VLAHAGLGEAYWRKYDATNDPQWVDLAAESAEQAGALLEFDLAPVRVTIGLIYKGTGRYDDAEREFLRALQIDSTNALAHQQLAATYYYLDRLEEAEFHYQRAIELKPGYWAFYNNLGFLYTSQGRHEEAARVYRRVIDLSPDNPWGYSNLGLQYHRMGQLDSAAVWYRRAAEVNPEATGPTALAYRNLGAIHIFQRNFVEAARMFEQSIEHDSTNHEAWSSLASASYWAGQHERAEEAWQRVISLDESALDVNPNDANALTGLALAFAMTERPDLAHRMLQRLNVLPNKEAVVYNDMALVAEQLGDRELALRLLEEGFSKGLTRSLVLSSPWFDALRTDSEYQAILRQVE